MEIHAAAVIDERFLGVICIGVVVGGLVGSLVGAVILRMAAFWAERLDIKYSDAFGTVFFIGSITTGIGLAGGFVMGLNQVDEAWLGPFNIIYVPTIFCCGPLSLLNSTICHSARVSRSSCLKS